MKKNFMLIVALAAMLFFAAPMTTEAAEGEGKWKQNATGWWYEFEDGSYLSDGMFEINGEWYYFDAAGYMKTGWVLVEYDFGGEGDEPIDEPIPADWYYFKSNGAMAKGWLKDGAAWYYLDPEAGWMWTNSLVGDTYYVGENGKMLTDDYVWGILYDGPTAFNGNGCIIKNGWFLVAEYEMYGWAYFDANGQYIQEGWLQDGTSWYYMAGGIARVGTYLMDYQGQTHLYKFGTDGRMIVDRVATTGWVEADGKWYYYEVSADYQGLVRDQWREIGGSWYYFDYDGEMYANDLVYDHVKECYYVVGADGSMVINQWLNVGSNTYPDWVYADGNGVAYENEWLQIGTTWYYFEGTTMVDSATRIDGRLNLFNRSGVWLGYINTSNGWVDAGDGDWFYLENNLLASGWRQLGGKWYYFDDFSGHMYADGVYWIPKQMDYYVFDSNGALTYGWYQDSWNDWCYADSEGRALENEWLQIGTTWYYFDGFWMEEDGLTWIDNEIHVFAKGGAWLGEVADNAEGWQLLGGKWYYFEYGEPAWGFRKIDGKVYGFDYQMLTNDYSYVWIEDYDYEGIRLGSRQYWIGFDANGNVAKNQWIYIDWYDEWVWFDANGYGLPPANYYGGGM